MNNRHAFISRLRALVRKEMRQMWRDKSNLAIGVVLPMVLILLFGYGISLDLKHAPVAVVLEDHSPSARDAVSALYGSTYISAVSVPDMPAAVQLLRADSVSAIVRVPPQFTHDLMMGRAQVQLIVHGAETNSANAIIAYVNGAFATQNQKQQARGMVSVDNAGGTPIGQVVLEQRLWFNAANTSTWYLVPGLIVLIITLVGAFLTSLMVAREWERGTFESLFVTPVQSVEILLAKLIPCFLVGLFGLALCMVSAKLLFAVPMYGSLLMLLLASVLYLFVALGMGLLISSVTKSQFLASQVTLVASFLPTMMLSGFIFDLHNAPLPIQIIGQIVPATHYMNAIKTLYLAGNVWSMVWKECLILAAYAVLFLALSRRVTRKRLN